MELRDYLRVVRRHWLLILLSTLLCATAGGLATLSVTSQYSSTARLFVSTARSDASDAYQGGLFSAERVTSYSDLATSRELAERVIEELGLGLSPEALSEQVTSRVVPETVILELSVEDPDPARAQLLTQEYAEQMTGLVKTLETPAGRSNAPIKATVVDAAGLPSSPSPRTPSATSRSRPCWA